MREFISICAGIATVLAASGVASANTVASSIIYFGSNDLHTLTDEGGGIFSGTLVATPPPGFTGYYRGFDIYAKSGATAWYCQNNEDEDLTWTSQLLDDAHDPWLTYSPDTPDWRKHTVRFFEEGGVQKWALRNHWRGMAAGTAAVPMSGTMNWTTMYAEETDFGYYLPPDEAGGPSECGLGMAATKGGGPGTFDMDWPWNSDVIPLEYPGYIVAITAVPDGFEMSMTPAPDHAAGVLGDFNNDSVVDHDDIDLIRNAILNVTSDPIFDIDGSGNDIPDVADFDLLITDIIGTGYGDGDLNKVINFIDFVLLANNFGQTGTLWNEGNVNVDNVTNFADFVLVENNFEVIFTSARHEIPEPSAFALLSITTLTGVVLRKIG